jgi:hypothetical protein
MILHKYCKNSLIPYGYWISFFINKHIHVLICSCCSCTMHHVVDCCKKMWNYINYSIMKWYIIILFSCNVYHTFVPHSKHISITSKSCSYLTIQNMMGYNHPFFFFEVKCDCMMVEGTLTSKRFLHTSCLSIKWFLSL